MHFKGLASPTAAQPLGNSHLIWISSLLNGGSGRVISTGNISIMRAKTAEEREREERGAAVEEKEEKFFVVLQPARVARPPSPPSWIRNFAWVGDVRVGDCRHNLFFAFITVFILLFCDRSVGGIYRWFYKLNERVDIPQSFKFSFEKRKTTFAVRVAVGKGFGCLCLYFLSYFLKFSNILAT